MLTLQPTRADLNLHNALRILRKNGFTNARPTREDGKVVIKVQATREEINSKIQGIVDASSYGVLIECESEFPEE